MLQIIVNSSNNVDIDESRVREISAVIEHRLGRFAERLTRIEAHISDETGHKPASMDKCCLLEAIPEGMHTLNVTEHGDTVDHAVRSATHTLERMIDDTFHRQEAMHERASREAMTPDEI